MISREQAIAIVSAGLNGGDSPLDDLVVMSVTEREFSWVIGWNTRLYAETGDIMHMIFGPGPMVISKATGKVAVGAGSHPPMLDRILEAEKKLGIEGEM